MEKNICLWLLETHHRACALVTVHSYVVSALRRLINTHASLIKSSAVSGACVSAIAFIHLKCMHHAAERS